MLKQRGFIKNTVILFLGMVITKGLGAALKIPLANILGGEGMGYFTTAYSIFTPVLAFSVSGIPLIVTQRVAKYVSSEKYGKAESVKRCSLLLSVIIGLMGTALIYITAIPFVSFIANSEESLLSVLIIAPAVLFCSVTGVYRGYYEGLNDMLPTALSQIIEAVVKAILGIFLSYYTYIKALEMFMSEEKALPYASAAAILGVSVSELCGTVFMLIRGRKKSDSLREYREKMSFSEVIRLSKDIFLKSLPVAFGAAAINLLSLADMLTVSNCINLSVKYFGYMPSENIVCSDLGVFMYGSYAGLVMSIYMLASAASALISRCALPRLSCAAAIGNKALSSEIKLLYKGTALIAAPVGIFISVLSEPILDILYANRMAEVSVSVAPLAILSGGVFITAAFFAVTTVFQAFGDFNFPIKIALIHGVLKLFFNIVLIPLPFMNISGTAASALISDLICLIWSVVVLKKKYCKEKLLIASFFSPVFSAVLSGGIVYCIFNALKGYGNDILSVFISGFTGVIAYAIIILVFDRESFTAFLSCIRQKREKSC